MIKGVIFDMDGVLVDNRDIHIEAFLIFLKRYGIEAKAGDLSWMFGMGNDEIMPRLLPTEIIEKKGIKALADEKEQVYREIFADSIKPMPGLTDFLKNIRSHGIKCAVGSSGNTDNVNFVLEKCSIANMFDAIANGDMVARAKPAPDVFLLAAQLLGLPAGECLVIEDSFAGIEASRSAGMKVIGMATTYTREELSKEDTVMIVSDFRELNYHTLEGIR